MDETVGFDFTRVNAAFRGLAEATAAAAKAWTHFHNTIDEWCDRSVDAMTPEQRDLYTSLIACGTPRLDAVIEARELGQ